MVLQRRMEVKLTMIEKWPKTQHTWPNMCLLLLHLSKLSQVVTHMKHYDCLPFFRDNRRQMSFYEAEIPLPLFVSGI